eukprot:1400499-Prorocentrum_lima.AAC.1
MARAARRRCPSGRVQVQARNVIDNGLGVGFVALCSAQAWAMFCEEGLCECRPPRKHLLERAGWH